MTDDDPPAAAARARKGRFEFPTNTRDLFSLFLDPDIDAARRQILDRIGRGQTVHGAAQGGRVDFTPAAQVVQRAVVNIQALTVQAERNQAQRRRQRQRGGQ